MAAPLRVYTCRTCKLPHKTSRYNQEVCSLCRFIENLEFWNEATAKSRPCMICNTKFLPMTRADKLCAECVITPASRAGTCVSCKTENIPFYWHKSVPICAYCALDPAPGARTSVTHAIKSYAKSDTYKVRRKRPLNVEESANLSRLKKQLANLVEDGTTTQENINLLKEEIPNYHTLPNEDRCTALIEKIKEVKL